MYADSIQYPDKVTTFNSRANLRWNASDAAFFIYIQLHNICLECQQRVLNQYVSFLVRLVFFYSMFVYINLGLNLYVFKLTSNVTFCKQILLNDHIEKGELRYVAFTASNPPFHVKACFHRLGTNPSHFSPSYPPFHPSFSSAYRPHRNPSLLAIHPPNQRSLQPIVLVTTIHR